MVPPTHLLRHPLPPPQTAAPADRNGSGSLGHWKRKSGRSGCHCLRILASWASHLHHLNHLNNLHHLTHLSAPLSLSVFIALSKSSAKDWRRAKWSSFIVSHLLSSCFSVSSSIALSYHWSSRKQTNPTDRVWRHGALPAKSLRFWSASKAASSNPKRSCLQRCRWPMGKCQCLELQQRENAWERWLDAFLHLAD